MFDTALKRLAGTDVVVTIYTPFGYSKGWVTKYDGECFEFKPEIGDRILTLYAEDLQMLAE